MAGGPRRRRRLVPPLLAALWIVAGASVPGVALAAPRASASLVSTRVVGGTAVPSITSFPYQAAVYVRSGAGLFGQYASLAFCGGVVIDPIQILTAAHCVVDDRSGAPVSPAAVTVLTGTATLPAAVPSQPNPASISIDPSYDPLSADYDLAVVTMAAPFYTGTPAPNGSATVAPIPLITPALAASFANPNLTPPEPVTISGWGETGPLAIGANDNSPNLPQQLQAAQTHLVADKTCATAYSALGAIGVPPITPEMLCAGEPSGAVDACSGDSGGPLVVDIDNPAAPPGDYVLAGLIDFGAGCAQAGYPGVYVRVATPQIASFVAGAAQAAGQQLTPAPTPVGLAPPRHVVATIAKASLSSSASRVRNRVALAAVRCATATCTGSLTLRTTTTIGVAHFTIAAGATSNVPIRITPTGQKLLDRHKHRLATTATLRTTGSGGTTHTFTITD